MIAKLTARVRRADPRHLLMLVALAALAALAAGSHAG
jgi:hypothetical protein